MADKFRVNSLVEALQLGRQFQSQGRYDLFRGQGQNWSVKPTIARLNSEEYEKGLEKLNRLHSYLATQGTLEKYSSDTDWFYAVAQHYGLPTNYIDFSRNIDIAAFFATHSNSNRLGEDCVIICLKENDFREFINLTKVIYANDKVVAPYIAKPNVDNLWRLQAQQGCFLYTPYSDFEFYYDFDRIIFPFSEPYNEIPIENIYPKRKSELEILLDHFFDSEKRLEGNERLRKFIQETNILHHEVPPINYSHLLKINKPHTSWNKDSLDKWSFKLTEEWDNTYTAKNIIIHFDKKKQIDLQIQEIIKELSTSFTNQNIDRKSTIVFEVIAKPKFTKKLSRTIGISCSRIWDGTRNLPFTDSEIHLIIAKYICLEFYENAHDETPSLTSEDLITLELTNELGSITRCYVSPSKIVLAFRHDIKKVLVDELSENICSEILLHINKPQLLFDFNKLMELFKDELISYQVLYNSEKENPVIYYTPAQITIMGYA